MTKISPRDLPTFLRNLHRYRVVLLYGEDAGAVHERGDALTRSVAGSARDPDLVVELERGDAARLADEATSLTLTGGRRVVRMRGAADAALDRVKRLVARAAPALVILEAGELSARSMLRLFAENDPDCAAVASYAEESATTADTVRRTLARDRVMIDRDAMTALTQRLGADRTATRGEVEKLALYAGAGGRVDMEAVDACVGDLSGASLEDALYAATAGDVALADRALGLAMEEGAVPVGVLRAALLHVQRLHQVRMSMDLGKIDAATASRAAKPPVFFKRTDDFVRALRLWSSDGLATACRRLSEAERDCKRTGWPDDVMARDAVLGIARSAAAVGRRLRRAYE